MTRLLLALLALLTGLAGQISPSQARVCVGAHSEIGLTVDFTAAKPRAAVYDYARHAGALRLHLENVGRERVLTDAPPVPAVRQGVDRARQ